MEFLLGIVWVIAVLGVLWVVISSSDSNRNAQGQNAVTNANKDHAADSESKAKDSRSGRWAEYKQIILHNEKIITSVSTIFIAAFTVVLAFATGFLYFATKELVEGADKNAEKQLRAYIGIHSSESTVYLFEKGGYAFITHADLRNYGQTPAYDVTVKSNVKIDFLENVPFNDFPGLERGVPSIAFRDASFHVNVGWPISEEDKVALFDRKKVFFFWGRVDYKDAFDKHHQFSFRMVSGQIAVGSSGIYTMGPYQNGYTAD